MLVIKNEKLKDKYNKIKEYLKLEKHHIITENISEDNGFELYINKLYNTYQICVWDDEACILISRNAFCRKEKDVIESFGETYDDLFEIIKYKIEHENYFDYMNFIEEVIRELPKNWHYNYKECDKFTEEQIHDARKILINLNDIYEKNRTIEIVNISPTITYGKSQIYIYFKQYDCENIHKIVI